MNVYGIRFRGPIVPGVEHKNTMFEDIPKKQNYTDTFERCLFKKGNDFAAREDRKGNIDEGLT